MNIKIPSLVADMAKELFSIAPNHLESFLISAVFPEDKVDMPVSELQQLGDEDHQVNVIPVKGVLMDESHPNHGIFGYRAMAQAHINGENNPKVLAHVLYINSPGGGVSGLAEFADQIHSSSKPVYAYIDKLGASAAYYIAAAAGHIMTSSRSSLIGNIGSKMSTFDLMGILENWGAKRVEVYGTKATHKDLGFKEAKEGKPEKLRSIMVDPANEMFVQDLAKYRPTLSEDFKNGMVYFSEDALSKKLVDSLGTYADLLNQIASDLQIKQSSQMSKKVTMLVPSSLVGGLKLMGGEVVETPSSDSPNSETTAEAEAPAATAPEAKAEAPKAEAPAENPLQAEVNSLKAQLKNKDEEVAGMKASLEALSNNPAAQRTESRQKGNDVQPKTENEDDMEALANTPSAEFEVQLVTKS